MFKNDSEEFEVRVNTINKTHEAKPTIYFLIFNISNRLGTTKTRNASQSLYMYMRCVA